MKRLMIMPALLALLAACATAPTTAPTAAQSFNQSVKIAGTANDAVIVTGNALLTSGVISSAQSKKILVITDQVNGLLVASNNAFVAGNTALANATLSTANSTTAAAATCLAPAAGGAILDQCLSTVGVK